MTNVKIGSETDCKTCKGLKYLDKDGVRVPCYCARLDKLKSYYPFHHFKKVSKSHIQKATENIKTLEVENHFHAVVSDLSETNINLFILFYLLKLGQPAYKVLNAYELVDIFLGKSEVFKSILEIEIPVLVVLYGYHEFVNKRQEDFLLQLFENYKRHNRYLLFLSKVEIEPTLLNYMKESDWRFLDLSKSKLGGAYAR